MKDFFGAIVVAFSMYSAVPMPKINWTEKNMKYAFCFFPLVGIAIGSLLIAWWKISEICGFNSMIFAGVATALPVIISGGIHMDGFCDTSDALASNAPKERKLEILKDSNCGAFAVIKTVIYFMLMFAFYTGVDKTASVIVAIGFVLSRALSGLAIVVFPKAKGSGLVAMFAKNANKTAVALTMFFYIAICGVGIAFIDVRMLVCVFVALVVFLYYYSIAKSQFGGTTGDLAGWFLQNCELFLLITAVVLKGL